MNLMMAMSDAQFEKVNQHLLANVDEFRASPQFEAIMRDHDMFGPGAIVQTKRI